MDARLASLAEAYQGLPGFLDVYYNPALEPAYRPTFLDAVPEGAAAVRVDVPVAFDVVPGPLVPLGPGTTPDERDLVCTGKVRPGMSIGNCTLAWILSGGGKMYAATAGHCTTKGDTHYANVEGVRHWGTTAFSTGNAGVGKDFALIEILPDSVPYVTGEMCNWAGPTASFSGSTITGQPTVQTGIGGGGLFIPPRPKTGIGQSWGSQSFQWVGSSIPGDSGSPIRLESGAALGVVTHMSLVVPVLDFGTTLQRGLQLAAADGITGLQLVTVTWTHPP